jgi:ribosome biogenesis GTPase / thiamine phosphate phosphatase
VLEAIGYDRDLARWAASADARMGRVLHVERGVATVLTEGGEVRATYGGRLLGWMAADSTSQPCAGDWVVLRDWPDRRVTLERIVPRRTALRACVGGRVLATNIDLVGIVVAADSWTAHPRLHDRMGPIAELARGSGARPLLVLTRCDLVDTLPEVTGCAVVATSARSGEGVELLRDHLEQHLTMALVGAPDQGKSALLKALVGDLAVRRAPRRQLHVLPQGGAVIDTPSLRAVA